MHTVLRTTAGRVSIALTLLVGGVGAAAAPALASAHPTSGHSAPATASTGSSTVEIGDAVAYERAPDGSIHRVR